MTKDLVSRHFDVTGSGRCTSGVQLAMPHNSQLEPFDEDVAALYRTQRHMANTQFNEFVVHSLSNLSAAIQLINNRMIAFLVAFRSSSLLCLRKLN